MPPFENMMGPSRALLLLCCVSLCAAVLIPARMFVDGGGASLPLALPAEHPAHSQLHASPAPRRRRVRSFDIFDTLLARRVERPVDIFGLVERKQGVHDFARRRVWAEGQANGTWAHIYDVYQQSFGLTDAERERLMSLELQEELDNIFLIAPTASRVRDGDILVSDMYLPTHAIQALLARAGFVRNASLFLSPAGKHSGTIWPQLMAVFDIELHVGDNAHSDVFMARRAGLLAEHATLHEMTATERLLFDEVSRPLAMLLREFRLSNPHAPESMPHRMWSAQVHNVPLLLLTAAQLGAMAKREGLSRILLTTRDGCLLEKVFATLPPPDGITAIRFHSSRAVLRQGGPEYEAYLRSTYLPNSSIIFDLHGSFASGRPLFMKVFGGLPRVHIMDHVGKDDAPLYPGLTFSTDRVDTDTIELLNLDVFGPLLAMDEKLRDIRGPLSCYTLSTVKSAHSAVDSFLDMARAKRLDHLPDSVAPVVWEHLLNEVWDFVGAAHSLWSILECDRSKTPIEGHGGIRGILSGFPFRCDSAMLRLLERTVLQPFMLADGWRMLVMGDQNTPVYAQAWRLYFGEAVDVHTIVLDPAQADGTARNRTESTCSAQSQNALELLGCTSGRGFDVILDLSTDGFCVQRLGTLWPSLEMGGGYILARADDAVLLETTAWSEGAFSGAAARDLVHGHALNCEGEESDRGGDKWAMTVTVSKGLRG